MLETVATLHLVKRREYLNDVDPLREAYRESETLFATRHAFRSSLDTDTSVREETIGHDDGVPF